MQNVNKIHIASAMVVCIIIYITISFFQYIFRDRTEEIRIERYNTSVQQEKQAQKDIDDAQIRKAKAQSCKEANSHTGVLANCELSAIISKVNAESWKHTKEFSEWCYDKEIKLHGVKNIKDLDDISWNVVRSQCDENVEWNISYQNYKSEWEKYQKSLNATGGISPVPKQVNINDKICTLGKIGGKKSPLCDNTELLIKLKDISKTKGVPFELMLGITYAESHIGVNFTPSVCENTNNWSGIKWAKLNDGTKVNQGIPNKDGCWLHTFKSVEEYWWSFANTLKLGYIDRGATTPEQISQYYVGNNGLVKYDWSQRVRQFYE